MRCLVVFQLGRHHNIDANCFAVPLHQLLPLNIYISPSYFDVRLLIVIYFPLSCPFLSFNFQLIKPFRQSKSVTFSFFYFFLSFFLLKGYNIEQEKKINRLYLYFFPLWMISSITLKTRNALRKYRAELLSTYICAKTSVNGFKFHPSCRSLPNTFFPFLSWSWLSRMVHKENRRSSKSHLGGFTKGIDFKRIPNLLFPV